MSVCTGGFTDNNDFHWGSVYFKVTLTMLTLLLGVPVFQTPVSIFANFLDILNFVSVGASLIECPRWRNKDLGFKKKKSKHYIG